MLLLVVGQSLFLFPSSVAWQVGGECGYESNKSDVVIRAV